MGNISGYNANLGRVASTATNKMGSTGSAGSLTGINSQQTQTTKTQTKTTVKYPATASGNEKNPADYSWSDFTAYGFTCEQGYKETKDKKGNVISSDIIWRYNGKIYEDYNDVYKAAEANNEFSTGTGSSQVFKSLYAAQCDALMQFEEDKNMGKVAGLAGASLGDSGVVEYEYKYMDGNIQKTGTIEVHWYKDTSTGYRAQPSLKYAW